VPHWIHKLLLKVYDRAIRDHEVARFETISIADFRRAGEPFVADVVESLRLVSQHDQRRFHRLQQTCRFVVNHVIPSGAPASYDPESRICLLDYTELRQLEPSQFRRAAIACLLVHEATHGALTNRRIPYTESNRLRIERLCMAEQNRFASRLIADAPELYANLHLDLRDSDWTSLWSRPRFAVLKSYAQRYFRKDAV
jgi:hypothetical protein